MRIAKLGAVRVLLALPVLAFGAVTGLAPASAAGGNIWIDSAGPTNGDPAVISVVAGDGNQEQLTSMTVHVLSGATDVLDVPMQYSTGSPGYQTWVSQSPIQQSQLQPGTYTMTVDASDQAETDTGLAAGTLPFVYKTTITVTATPDVVSWNHWTVTVSGTLTGVQPGAGGDQNPVPMASVPVYLFDANGSTPNQQVATTAADGTYSGTVQLDGDEWWAEVDPNSTTGATGMQVSYTWKSDPTRVTATVSPEDFVYGSSAQATMSGKAEYQDGSTWLPLANFTIMLKAGATIHNVQTDANGAFTWTYPPADGTSWSVLVGGGDFLGVSQAYGTIHIAVPMTVSQFSASLDPFGLLHTSGCVHVTAPGFGGPNGRHMVIQTSRGPNGPWINLGKVPLSFPTAASCAGGGDAQFSGSVGIRYPNAYYQAVYPGDVDFQRAVSSAVRRWKYPTRIQGLRVSPRSVAKGGSITVSGHLQKRVGSGSWKAFARQQILIILKPKGSKVWYWIHKVKTNSAGFFTKTFADPVTAKWSAFFRGGKLYFASAGKAYLVTVAGGAGQRTAVLAHPLGLPRA